MHGLIGWAQASVDKAQRQDEEEAEYLFLNDSSLAGSLGATFDMRIYES